MARESEYIKLDFMKIAEGLLRRLWLIVLAMVVCGALLFSYAAFMVTPMYEASTLMYVNNSSFSVGSTSFSISASEITAAKSLVETYLVILKTRLTLNEVIERSGVDCTYEELYSMISAESVNETEVFAVTVTSEDPAMAEYLANTIAMVLPDKIADIVEGSSVSIVDYAVVPSQPVSPSLSKYTIVGLLGGMLLSCAAIAVLEVRDNKIRTENYLLENYASIPLLTTVPDLYSEASSRSNYYYRQPEQEQKTKQKGQRRRAK